MVRQKKELLKMINEIIQKLGLNKLNITTAHNSNFNHSLRVVKNNNDVLIEYKNKVHLIRALGIIKRNIDICSIEVEENTKFENLSYLIDTARDAVPTVNTLKDFILDLALLGYNQVYLYLEDTFEVINEPYFGYLRGRYSESEIKELDKYCVELGIELIPAIQTLAHLNCIFKWPTYKSINDINDILLVDEKRTTELIENMFKTVFNTFTSRTIHIGMDEAHLVGRGKYLDRHNYEKQFDVISHQLKIVKNIASKYNFKLQMWSDMYFRLAFNGAYYTEDGILPDEITKNVDKNIDIFYWDYVTDNSKIFENMLKNHRLLSEKTCFAAGAWKWNGFNPSNKFSIYNLSIQLPKCLEYKIKDIMLTGWSDDGAEASIYSTLPTIIYVAEFFYGECLTDKHLNIISTSLFDFDFKSFLDTDLTLVSKEEELCKYNYLNYSNLPKILLYNDPLVGAYDGVINSYFKLDSLKSLVQKNWKIVNSSRLSYYFETIRDLLSVLDLKATLGLEIRKFYHLNDKTNLNRIANNTIPELIKRIDRLYQSFYNQWHKENKSYGFDIHSIRIGGLKQRLIDTKTIINEYLDNKRKKIEELEEHLNQMDEEDALGFVLWTNWRNISNSGVN